jgi:hypothetical protein
MMQEDIMKELNKILEMWAVDCKILPSLEQASRDTPLLHAKYLPLWSQATVHIKRLEAQQKILLKRKWLYYAGKLTREQIEEYGWDYDPFDGLKVLKSDMDKYYDADTDIQKSVTDIAYWKTIIDTLNEILASIRWRHQTIGNAIKFRIFEAGG